MILRTVSARATNGWLRIGNRLFLCQLGRAGRFARKVEGDGTTPIGIWPVVSVYYRADRLKRPKTMLPVKTLRPEHGWCDDPMDRNYNKPVTFPYSASAERLWREDHAYDLIVVLDYNFSHRAMNLGSAIFLHLAHDDQRPTAGCLAFCERDMRMILKYLRPGDQVVVRN
ncbi:MAG: L,D-transpeptidase family protein [bacterium]|nr:L,D-transpeptidase family protein [bacterium]